MMTRDIVLANPVKVNDFLKAQFGDNLHTKRIESIANGVAGLLASGSLQPARIGRGLASVKGTLPKHAIKQTDRLIGNCALDPYFLQLKMAEYLISKRRQIYVAMDWTVFAKDSQMTLTLRLITKHGRATPLLWETVSTEGLKNNKVNYAFKLLERLRQIVHPECNVIVLADREFGTNKNFNKIKKELNFDYILRVRRNFTITDKHGESRLAHEWYTPGKTLALEKAKITLQYNDVEKVIICKDKDMKDLWCLAASTKHLSSSFIKKLYGKRWGTETSYRDEKDIQFGLGLKKSRIKNTLRRDRLFLISALAIILLTLLGAASEKVGFDKYIKANTSPRRTHSLFFQGRVILQLMSHMRQRWRDKLIEAFYGYLESSLNIHSEQFVI